MEPNDLNHGEIIIVRRSKSDHDDEHHGGVWKIAFADFMTAMMAFFLVMWLINASNEETRKSVASYFNPIKLMDTTTNPKGLKTPKYGIKAESNEDPDPDSTAASIAGTALTKNEIAVEASKERSLFADPYALLEEIVGEITQDKSASELDTEGDGQQSKGRGLSDGVAFQDPFDPAAWQTQFGSAEIARNESKTEEQSKHNSTGLLKSTVEQIDVEIITKDADDQSKPDEASSNQTVDEVVPTTKTEPLAEKIKLELKDEEARGLKVDVVDVGNGTLITISDQLQIGMFNVGSARPTPELVKIMMKIGEILSANPGLLTISGHTDGRQYTSGDYDNWRLSTARAHMAYYMLLKGGLSEKSVEKIEGHADAKLKVKDKPFSPENRRIEVFLRKS